MCFYQLNVMRTKLHPVGVGREDFVFILKCVGIVVGFILRRAEHTETAKFFSPGGALLPPWLQTEKAGGTGFSSTAWRFPPRESMQGLYRHADTMCIKAWKGSQLISPSALFSVFLHPLSSGCHLCAICCCVCSFCVDGTLQLVKL